MINLTKISTQNLLRKGEDIKSLNKKQLVFDYALLHALFNKIRAGKKIQGWSKEDVINHYIRLIRVMRSKGLNINPDTALSKEAKKLTQRLSFSPRVLSNEDLIIEHAETHKNWDVDRHNDLVEEMLRRGIDHRPRYDEEMDDKIFLTDVLPYFRSFKIHKPYISLVGSLAVQGYGNDIDILIKDDPDSPVARILEFRLREMVPDELKDRLHFVYDWEGPFTNYFTLLDLEAVPTQDYALQMMEAEKVEPLKPFTPPKTRGTYHKDEFYSLEGVMNYFVPLWIKQGVPVVVERKYDGIRVIISKKGSEIKIFTEDKKQDIASRLPSVVKDLKSILPDEVIIDAELMSYSEGTFEPRKDLMKFIQMKTAPSDESVILFGHDIIWYNGSLLGKSWKEYYPYLKRIRDSKHFKKSQPIIASSAEKLESAIKTQRVKPGSEGAMLKPTSEPYTIGRPVNWAKFKNVRQLYVEVIEVFPVKGTTAYNYKIGINDKGKLMSIGKTFNTKLKAKVGDIIEVSFVKLIKSGTKEKPKYGIFQPRVVAVMRDRSRPDTIEDAEKIVAQGTMPVEVKQHLSSNKDLTDEKKKEIYKKWNRLVNMSSSELKEFMQSKEGRVAGLTREQAAKAGIKSGRESAAWIIKMLDTSYKEWSLSMWRWATRQISFISRMRSVKGPLYDKEGKKTRKHLALLIWGHDPDKKMQILQAGPAQEEKTVFSDKPLMNLWDVKEGDYIIQWHFRGFPPEFTDAEIRKIMRLAISDKLSEAQNLLVSLAKQKGVKKAEEEKVSIHMDLRFDIGDRLVGVTLDDPGSLEGEVRLGDPMKKSLTQVKAAQPKIWIKLKDEVFDVGEVGASPRAKGGMIEYDSGKFQPGVQKPFFHEVFLNGKKLKSRLVIRKLPKPSGFEKAGKEELIWLTWLTKDQIPTMLGLSTIKNKYIPPDNRSGLPMVWETKIPKELRWWDKKVSLNDKVELIKEARKLALKG